MHWLKKKMKKIPKNNGAHGKPNTLMIEKNLQNSTYSNLFLDGKKRPPTI